MNKRAFITEYSNDVMFKLLVTIYFIHAVCFPKNMIL